MFDLFACKRPKTRVVKLQALKNHRYRRYNKSQKRHYKLCIYNLDIVLAHQPSYLYIYNLVLEILIKRIKIAVNSEKVQAG